MQTSSIGQKRRNFRRPPPLVAGAAGGSSEFGIFESRIDIRANFFSVSGRHWFGLWVNVHRRGLGTETGTTQPQPKVLVLRRQR